MAEPIDHWVRAHVLSKLDNQAEPHDVLKFRLWQFLQSRQQLPIYADWPEDFVHLLQCLSDSQGRMPSLELELRLIKRSSLLRPETPHHALSDARALMQWHQFSVASGAARKSAI